MHPGDEERSYVVRSALKRVSQLAVLGLASGALVLGASSLHAQASPYVPTDDRAYADLDVLIARGLVSGVVLGQRPYSRMAFARATQGARAAGGHEVGGRIGEAIERLGHRFRRELARVCLDPDPGCPRSGPYVAGRDVAFTATVAESPGRPIVGRHHTASVIDADANPLLQRNHGRALDEGGTGSVEATLDFGLGERVAAQLIPRVWVGTRGRDRSDVGATLMAGYVRAVAGNASLDLGRNHVTRGYSKDLAPVLSANPRPLNMVRLGMEEPRPLPWIFRYLGPSRWTLTVADLGGNSDTPGSKLPMIEGSIRPHPDLELGFTWLAHQGGDGAPRAAWHERVREFVGFWLARRPFNLYEDLDVSDKMLGLEANLRLRDIGAELFIEMVTTDDHNVLANVQEGLVDNGVWTVGARFRGLGEASRLDVWGEASHSGPEVYTHAQFSSGFTVDRRVLGSALGPTAAAVQVGVEWWGTSSAIAAALALERYEGDTYHDPPGGGPLLERLADNPDEIRKRIVVDWTKLASRPGLETSLRLGYEHVTRFDFTDRNRSNFLAQVSVGYVW